MKPYYKEYLGVFLFQTVCFILMSVILWFGHKPDVSKNIVILPIIGWIVCTAYIVKQVRFKK